MLLSHLPRQVLDANLKLVRQGLIYHTFGSARGIVIELAERGPGLVYGVNPLPSEAQVAFYKRPAFLAVVVGVVFVVLNIMVW